MISYMDYLRMRIGMKPKNRIKIAYRFKSNSKIQKLVKSGCE